MGSKINIDEFVIDDVFDTLKNLGHKVAMKKGKKKHGKNKDKDEQTDGKMVININV